MHCKSCGTALHIDEGVRSIVELGRLARTSRTSGPGLLGSASRSTLRQLYSQPCRSRLQRRREFTQSADDIEQVLARCCNFSNYCHGSSVDHAIALLLCSTPLVTDIV